MVQGSGYRVQGAGYPYRLQGTGYRVQGTGSIEYELDMHFYNFEN